MHDELMQFQWDVYTEGYQWIKVIDENHPKKASISFLTTGLPLGGGKIRIKRYNPLQMYTALYRHFSELDLSQNAILDFANTYGTLGGDAEEMITIPSQDIQNQLVVGDGEPFHKWKKHIRLMRQTLTLWDAIQIGDTETLSKHIRWSGPDGVSYQTHPELKIQEGHGKEWIASHTNPDLLERFKPYDLVEPAQYYIQRKINQQMKGHISQRLLWNHERDKLSLYSVPDSLIAALWLQFAQSISGNKIYRSCHQCGIWYEINPDIARTNKRYCSNACRSKGYRNRQATAKKLYDEGITIEEIALQLDIESATVRRWIGEKQ